MNTQWTRTNRQIEIEQGFPIAARLFAIPLLLVAAYLGFQLAAALLESLRSLATGELMGEMVGLALLAVFLLAFAVPGLFLLLGHKRVTVATDQVIEEMRWLVLSHRTSYSVEPFRAVRIDYEVGSGGTTRFSRPVLFTFDVVLVDALNRSRLLAMFPTSQLPQARALAKGVADSLHLKLSDHSAKWDPATRGKIPQDIVPIRQWLERRGMSGVPLEMATWLARGVHFVVDALIR